MNNVMNKIYTRNWAADIINYFEDILIENDIAVPSPEDDERDPRDNVGLYGSTYGDLLDNINGILNDLCRDVFDKTYTFVNKDWLKRDDIYEKIVEENSFE